MATKSKDSLARELERLAIAGCSVAETSECLGIDKRELQRRLKSDARLAKVWRQARTKLILSLKSQLLRLARDGNVAAVRRLESILSTEQIERPSGGLNTEALTTKELCSIIGKPRQTVSRWVRDHGLPRRPDKRYSLSEFFLWYTDFCEAKFAPSDSGGDGDGDTLRAMKGERLKLELQEKRGQLLDRAEVIVGLCARHRIMLDWAHRQVRELPRLLEGRRQDGIAELLKKSITELRREMCKIPEELRLPPKPEKLLLALLDNERM